MYCGEIIKQLGILMIITVVLYAIYPGEIYASDIQDMINHPEKYIVIHKYGFYVAARVGIIHHVQIENTADIPYKNIKVKLYYYLTNTHPGQLVSSTGGILPVTVPPKSNNVYLRGGTTLGAGSNQFDARNIEVLSAIPITD